MARMGSGARPLGLLPWLLMALLSTASRPAKAAVPLWEDTTWTRATWPNFQLQLPPRWRSWDAELGGPVASKGAAALGKGAGAGGNGKGELPANVRDALRGAKASSLQGPYLVPPPNRQAVASGLDAAATLHLGTLSESDSIGQAVQVLQCRVCKALLQEAWYELGGWTLRHQLTVSRDSAKATLKGICNKIVPPLIFREWMVVKIAFEPAVLEEGEDGQLTIKTSSSSSSNGGTSNGGRGSGGKGGGSTEAGSGGGGGGGSVRYLLRPRSNEGATITELRAVRQTCLALVEEPTPSGVLLLDLLLDKLEALRNAAEAELSGEAGGSRTPGAKAGTAQGQAGTASSSLSSSSSSSDSSSESSSSKADSLSAKAKANAEANKATEQHRSSSSPSSSPTAGGGSARKQPKLNDCRDFHELCASWASKGECRANVQYMVGTGEWPGNCRKACGACKPPADGTKPPLSGLPKGIASRLHRAKMRLLGDLDQQGCVAGGCCSSPAGVLSAAVSSAGGAAGTGQLEGIAGAAGEQLVEQLLQLAGLAGGLLQPGGADGVGGGDLAQAMQAAMMGQAGEPLAGGSPGAVAGAGGGGGAAAVAVQKVNIHDRQASRVIATRDSSQTLTCAVMPCKQPLRGAVDHSSAHKFVTQKLGGTCFYITKGWWTYEVCPGFHVRQMHSDGESQGLDPLYSLGTVDREATLRRFSDQQPPPVTADALLAGMPMRALPFVGFSLTGGTPCDAVGKDGEPARVPRRSELRVVCSPDEEWYLIVDEPKECSYVITLFAPPLCQLPGYRVGAGSKATGDGSKATAAAAGTGTAAKDQAGGGGGGRPSAAVPDDEEDDEYEDDYADEL